MNFYNEEKSIYIDIDEIVESTENRITELSRHLQTYLNYKTAFIRTLSWNLKENHGISNINSIQKWELELNSRILKHKKYLKKNIEPNEDLKLRVLLLSEMAKSSPKSSHAKEFNDFLRNKIRLWQLLHVLSVLEIYTRPHLLKLVIEILIQLYYEEEILNENSKDFFKQIKLNYKLLNEEITILRFSMDKEHFNIKDKMVMTRE